MTTDSTDFALHFSEEADVRTPKPTCKPVDRIDEAALRHDIYYRERPSERERIAGDDVMLQEIRELPHPTLRERLERIIVCISPFID